MRINRQQQNQQPNQSNKPIKKIRFVPQQNYRAPREQRRRRYMEQRSRNIARNSNEKRLRRFHEKRRHKELLRHFTELDRQEEFSRGRSRIRRNQEESVNRPHVYSHNIKKQKVSPTARKCYICKRAHHRSFICKPSRHSQLQKKETSCPPTTLFTQQTKLSGTPLHRTQQNSTKNPAATSEAVNRNYSSIPINYETQTPITPIKHANITPIKEHEQLPQKNPHTQCYTCGSKDHWSKQCTHIIRTSKIMYHTHSNPVGFRKITRRMKLQLTQCFICNSPEHCADKCPQRHLQTIKKTTKITHQSGSNLFGFHSNTPKQTQIKQQNFHCFICNSTKHWPTNCPCEISQKSPKKSTHRLPKMISPEDRRRDKRTQLKKADRRHRTVPIKDPVTDPSSEVKHYKNQPDLPIIEDEANIWSSDSFDSRYSVRDNITYYDSDETSNDSRHRSNRPMKEESKDDYSDPEWKTSTTNHIYMIQPTCKHSTAEPQVPSTAQLTPKLEHNSTINITLNGIETKILLHSGSTMNCRDDLKKLPEITVYSIHEPLSVDTVGGQRTITHYVLLSIKSLDYRKSPEFQTKFYILDQPDYQYPILSYETGRNMGYQWINKYEEKTPARIPQADDHFIQEKIVSQKLPIPVTPLSATVIPPEALMQISNTQSIITDVQVPINMDTSVIDPKHMTSTTMVPLNHNTEELDTVILNPTIKEIEVADIIPTHTTFIINNITMHTPYQLQTSEQTSSKQELYPLPVYLRNPLGSIDIAKNPPQYKHITPMLLIQLQHKMDNPALQLQSPTIEDNSPAEPNTYITQHSNQIMLYASVILLKHFHDQTTLKPFIIYTDHPNLRPTYDSQNLLHIQCEYIIMPHMLNKLDLCNSVSIESMIIETHETTIMLNADHIYKGRLRPLFNEGMSLHQDNLPLRIYMVNPRAQNRRDTPGNIFRVNVHPSETPPQNEETKTDSANANTTINETNPIKGETIRETANSSVSNNETNASGPARIIKHTTRSEARATARATVHSSNSPPPKDNFSIASNKTLSKAEQILNYSVLPPWHFRSEEIPFYIAPIRTEEPPAQLTVYQVSENRKYLESEQTTMSNLPKQKLLAITSSNITKSKNVISLQETRPELVPVLTIPELHKQRVIFAVSECTDYLLDDNYPADDFHSMNLLEPLITDPIIELLQKMDLLGVLLSTPDKYYYLIEVFANVTSYLSLSFQKYATAFTIALILMDIIIFKVVSLTQARPYQETHLFKILVWIILVLQITFWKLYPLGILEQFTLSLLKYVDTTSIVQNRYELTHHIYIPPKHHQQQKRKDVIPHTKPPLSPTTSVPQPMNLKKTLAYIRKTVPSTCQP